VKLLVDRLDDSPRRFAFEGESAWWRVVRSLIPELDVEGAPPLGFEVQAHRMGADVYLEGRVEGSIELVCSRCTSRYRHRLGESFRLVLEPAGDRVPADPEGVEALDRDGLWLGDELEAGWFRGNVIDLGAFFREVVTLALPVQPLCAEDCRGLCPRCGADRNVDRCDCPEKSTHSPFAALAALRGGSQKGGT
jgi:uncharacterized protein